LHNSLFTFQSIHENNDVANRVKRLRFGSTKAQPCQPLQ